MIRSPFLRHLLANLRITFFLIIAAVGVVVGYALWMHQTAHWEIVGFVAVGMTLSSIINAWYDRRRRPSDDS